MVCLGAIAGHVCIKALDHSSPVWKASILPSIFVILIIIVIIIIIIIIMMDKR